METREILGHNLRRYRKMSKLTQEEVAQRLGVSLQTVSRWERGAKVPTVEHLEALADLYGVDVADFFIPPMKGSDMYIKRILQKLKLLQKLESKKRERVYKLIEEQLEVLAGI